VNLLCILMWTYGSGEVELMEEGITSSGGMVGAGAHGEVDPWRGGGARSMTIAAGGNWITCGADHWSAMMIATACTPSTTARLVP